MNKKILIGLSAITLLVPLTFIGCNKNVDQTCNLVKEHYRDYFFYNTDISDYDIKPIDKIKEEYDTVVINDIETYKFKKEIVDYETDWHRADWPAREHLSRALQIAIVAENRNSNELRDIAKKLTLHWVLSNYKHINWWHNELGANDTLGKLGLFVFDNLGRKGQAAFNGKIRESSLKWRPSLTTSTGANMFDYIDITIRDAAINNDKEEMSIAFERMKQEITDEKREGFQKDGTFFQHGRQLQNVSYGKCAMRIAKTLYQLRGTDFKMPDEKMKILSDYVNRGLRASTFKGYTNYTTVGRSYDRVNSLDSQNTSDSGLNDLAYYIGVENYPGKDKTYEFVSALRNRKNHIKEDEIIYFPIGKLIVANIGHDETHDGIYISYKGTDPDITNSEIVNGENVLGINLTYGGNTCVMDKGTEYFNIAPVMNYNYMPGTTAPFYGTDAKTPVAIESQDKAIATYIEDVYNDPLFTERLPTEYEYEDKGVKKIVTCIYNDGQQDDVTFMMTKSRHHNRGKFTTTCFTTKDGMVLVGSDLGYKSLDGDATKAGEEHKLTSDAVHTTIDQYVTSDPVEELTDKTVYNHSNGNVIYKSLDSRTIKKTIETRKYTGDKTKSEDYWAWNRNNLNLKTEDSGTKNVATITLEGDPSSYAYAIQPSYSLKTFELVKNSDGIHAISYKDKDGKDKVAAAFYDKNNLSFDKYSIKPEEFIEGKGCFKIFDK